MASSYLDELQAAVKENSKEALDKLNDKLAFPSDFTAQCHQKNVEIMKKRTTVIETKCTVRTL